MTNALDKQWVGTFTFQTKAKNKYWLPLYMNTDSKVGADALLDAVGVALTEKGHTILERGEPVILRLGDLEHGGRVQKIADRLRGQRGCLILQLWEGQVEMSPPTVRFQDYVSNMFRQPERYDHDIILTRVNFLNLPVAELERNQPGGDFLMLDVLKPPSEVQS
jgi:hypothetical protein